jgi:hypothetical protein
MKKLFLFIAAGAMQITAGGIAGCATSDRTGITGYGCKTEYISDRFGLLFRQEVIIEEGYGFIHVVVKNEPEGHFDPYYFSPDFAWGRAWFTATIEIYGVPGDFVARPNFEFRSDPNSSRGYYVDVKGNRIDIWLDISSAYTENVNLSYDAMIRLTSIELFDRQTGEPLTGYRYSEGPPPGMMVGGILAAPEPATVGLAACALFALALWRRRVSC